MHIPAITLLIIAVLLLIAAILLVQISAWAEREHLRDIWCDRGSGGVHEELFGRNAYWMDDD